MVNRTGKDVSSMYPDQVTDSYPVIYNVSPRTCYYSLYLSSHIPANYSYLRYFTLDPAADRAPLKNTGGNIASLYPSLVKRIIPFVRSGSATADITREVNGNPLTTDWLIKALSISGKDIDPDFVAKMQENILGFDAPPQTAIRGGHSHVVYLDLRVVPSFREELVEHNIPEHLILKRSVARDLSPRSPEKLSRDVKSYANEAHFMER